MRTNRWRAQWSKAGLQTSAALRIRVNFVYYFASSKYNTSIIKFCALFTEIVSAPHIFLSVKVLDIACEDNIKCSYWGPRLPIFVWIMEAAKKQQTFRDSFQIGVHIRALKFLHRYLWNAVTQSIENQLFQDVVGTYTIGMIVQTFIINYSITNWWRQLVSDPAYLFKCR